LLSSNTRDFVRAVAGVEKTEKYHNAAEALDGQPDVAKDKTLRSRLVSKIRKENEVGLGVDAQEPIEEEGLGDLNSDPGADGQDGPSPSPSQRKRSTKSGSRSSLGGAAAEAGSVHKTKAAKRTSSLKYATEGAPSPVSPGGKQRSSLAQDYVSAPGGNDPSKYRSGGSRSSIEASPKRATIKGDKESREQQQVQEALAQQRKDHIQAEELKIRSEGLEHQLAILQEKVKKCERMKLEGAETQAIVEALTARPSFSEEGGPGGGESGGPTGFQECPPEVTRLRAVAKNKRRELQSLRSVWWNIRQLTKQSQGIFGMAKGGESIEKKEQAAAVRAQILELIEQALQEEKSQHLGSHDITPTPLSEVCEELIARAHDPNRGISDGREIYASQEGEEIRQRCSLEASDESQSQHASASQAEAEAATLPAAADDLGGLQETSTRPSLDEAPRRWQSAAKLVGVLSGLQEGSAVPGQQLASTRTSLDEASPPPGAEGS